MKRCFQFLLLMLTALLVAACKPVRHDILPSQETTSEEGEDPWGNPPIPEGEPVAYLSIALTWENEEDMGTEIHDVLVFIRGDYSKKAHFTSAGQVAEYLHALPEGTYDLLVMVNMSEADGYRVSDQGDIVLVDPSQEPGQAYYAVLLHVTVVPREITVATCRLRRLETGGDLLLGEASIEGWGEGGSGHGGQTL